MIGIIEYNMGNIQSVMNAFEHIGAGVRIVEKAADLADCDKIVLPGVGAFGVGIDALRERGFIEALEREVIEQKKPFLGICLGMQLICRESFEFGRHKGLSWIDAIVRRLPEGKDVRIPHVGWNDITIKRKSCLIDAAKDLDVYFIHSYYADVLDDRLITATSRCGIEFTAMIERDNIYATQFHPEKSQKIGLGILKRFIEI